jgi:hypothetical protein
MNEVNTEKIHPKCLYKIGNKGRNPLENKKGPAPAPDGRHLPFSSKDLALLWRIPFSSETEPDKVEIALRERIKELNCLYGVSQLAERNLHSLDNLLQELVNFR